MVMPSLATRLIEKAEMVKEFGFGILFARPKDDPREEEDFLSSVGEDDEEPNPIGVPD